MEHVRALKLGLTLLSFLFGLMFLPVRVEGDARPDRLSDDLSLLEDGSLSELKEFLGRYSPNATDASGRTPMFSVLRWKTDRVEGVSLLLRAGADVNAQLSDDLTVLAAASATGDPELVALLLRRGASVFQGQPLHHAFFAWTRRDPGDPKEVIRHLIEAGAPLESCDRRGRRPIHLAILRQQSEVVEMLLRAGADPDAPELDMGNAPLIWAAASGLSQAVEPLLAAGAPVDARNPYDCSTALHRAAAGGHSSTVEILLAAGASVNLSDRHAETPLTLAEQGGHEETAHILRRVGARRATLATVTCTDQAARERKACLEPAKVEKEAYQLDGDYRTAVQKLEDLVGEWEAAHSILPARDLVQELEANLSYTAGMLCVAPRDKLKGEHDSRCRELLSGGAGLKQAVGAYLTETLIEQRPHVDSLFSRLAAALGVDAAAQLGYPASQPNRYSCHSLPEPGRAVLPTLGGTRISAGPVSKICVLPGDYEVDVIDVGGNVRTFRLSAALRRATLSEGLDQRAFPSVVVTSPHFYCADPPGNRRSHPMTRWVGRDARQSKPQAAGAFATATFGRLGIVDKKGYCTGSCRRALALSAVQAVQLWKGACDACLPSSLSLLGLDDRVYVDRVLLDRLLLGSDIGHALSSPTPTAEEGSLHMNRVSVAGPRPRRPFAPFVEILRGSTLSKALCRKIEASSSAPAFLKNLFCNPTWKAAEDSAEQASLRITLVERAQCAPNAVACADVQQGVSLSAGKYIFRASPELSPGDESTVEFGRSEFAPVDLSTVLIHEVGHWFGLPHLDDDRLTPDGRINVMYPSLSSAGHCLTTANLQMLENAGRGDWYYKQRQCAGLGPADDWPTQTQGAESDDK